jgi:glycosyltransferase involved in cell wall biosynthesis
MQRTDHAASRPRARAFICDPVCAQPFGHNVVGLKYFSDAARPFFQEIIPLSSRALPQKIRDNYGFVGAFAFYYHRQIDIGHRKSQCIELRDAAGAIVDTELRSAEDDFRALFEQYRPTSADAIVFPSVDYYGALGAFAALEQMKPADAPALYIRFIGVMENASSNDLPGLLPMLRRIADLRRAGHTIKLCAETPRYADYLAREIGSPVDVVPYPPHGDVSSDASQSSREDEESSQEIAQRPSRPFTVSCPGSSRYDKGYLSLRDIFWKVRSLDPEIRIRFVTQGLPIHEAVHHSQYTNQLYALPGVRILPSSLSEQQINDGYRQSDLVILPYDPAIYQYRGSAVFMECLARGIPVIAQSGSAFCEQIAYYGAGVVVDGVDAMVTEIVRHSMRSPRSMRIQLTQAKHRYNIDAAHAFATWVKP